MAATQAMDGSATIYQYNELYNVPEHPDDVSEYKELYTGVDKFAELQERIIEAYNQDTYEEVIYALSFILKDHVNTNGNHKIADNNAIFNLNSAHECPNRESDNCQVPWEACYAGRAERQYPAVEPYRNRQQYLWDCMDADTFVDAFKAFVSRMRKSVDYLRLSEAGDFREDGDVRKADRIAERLKKEMDIQVYTYSASDMLDEWDNTEWITVNQSNNNREYGDRHYTAIPEGVDPKDIPWLDDDARRCPNDAAAEAGVPAKDRPKCGECDWCPEKESPDIYTRLRT